MKRLLILFCVFVLIFGLCSCGKSTAENTSSMPVVVLPESSIPTVTVQTESDDKAVTKTNYIGNKNSKVYHKEGCSSVKSMKDENKVGFATADEAVDKGYKSCGICLK